MYDIDYSYNLNILKMKKFSLLLLAAILGGVATLGGFKLFYEKDKPIKIEHVTQTPVYEPS